LSQSLLQSTRRPQRRLTEGAEQITTDGGPIVPAPLGLEIGKRGSWRFLKARVMLLG